MKIIAVAFYLISADGQLTPQHMFTSHLKVPIAHCRQINLIYEYSPCKDEDRHIWCVFIYGNK